MMAQHLAPLALLLAPLLASANQPDVFFPHYEHGCGAAGCAVWAQIPGADKMFAARSVPKDAGSSCAIPGRVTGSATGPPSTAASGPFCYCKDAVNLTAVYCAPHLYIPEQINLQYGSPDTVVAAFVTFELAPPNQAPQATLVEAGSAAAPQALSGVSHWLDFTPPGDKPNTTAANRNYTMSFVKFANLKPATHYIYKVRSGAAEGVWSEEFTFRTARAAPETAIGMFGDMAITAFNAGEYDDSRGSSQPAAVTSMRLGVSASQLPNT